MHMMAAMMATSECCGLRHVSATKESGLGAVQAGTTSEPIGSATSEHYLLSVTTLRLFPANSAVNA